MAIAFDAVSGTTGGGVSSLTFPHTVAAGGVLVVGAAYLGDTPTVTGVTYDGVALTQFLATTDDSGAGIAAKNSAWGIHNPTTGVSRNIVVSYSAAGGGSLAAHGLSYTGVANSSAAAMHRSIFHAGDPGGGGGGVDNTVTDSANGDLVVGFCATFNGATNLAAGNTSRKINLAVDGGSYDYGSEDAAATGANQVMSWTGDDFCTNIAFALIPSGGGGGGRTTKNTRAFPLGLEIGMNWRGSL